MEELLELLALETLITGGKKTHLLEKLLCLIRKKYVQGETSNKKSHASEAVIFIQGKPTWRTF